MGPGGAPTPGIAASCGLALAFGLACVALWLWRRDDWPRVGMSALGTAAATGAVTWVSSSVPTPGAGAVGTIGFLLAMVITPIVAIIAAVIAAVVARKMSPAFTLAWCFAMMVLFAATACTSVWADAWGQLC